MANTLFFAWQLDTPSKDNKTLIRNALVKAIENPDTELQESPRIETDTTGVPGSPNIVETIFRRIREASYFVADLTFVAESSKSRKKVPNPNVLIELGYAARSIGWERTILVFNNSFGETRDLPFDILQHRWPIEYRISDSTKVRDKRFESLSSALRFAIQDCDNFLLERASQMASRLDSGTLEYISENRSELHILLPNQAENPRDLLFQNVHVQAVRKLVEVGALEFTDQPKVGYRWTSDGQNMIAVIDSKFPNLLNSIESYRSTNSDYGMSSRPPKR